MVEDFVNKKHLIEKALDEFCFTINAGDPDDDFVNKSSDKEIEADDLRVSQLRPSDKEAQPSSI